MRLQVVETTRLYQLVAAQIEKMIRSGQIETGSRLPSERELAVQLGVSRPSVREAMVALEIAGLIEIKTGSGIYVRSEPEPQEVTKKSTDDASSPGPFEILETRLLLEPSIAAEAAKKATPEDIAQLRTVLHAMKSTTDPQIELQHDRQFHFLVACATKNMTLANIVSDLWSHNFTAMHSGISNLTGLFNTEDMDYQDHSEIVQQIELRSTSGARRAMRDHLRHVRAILLKS